MEYLLKINVKKLNERCKKIATECYAVITSMGHSKMIAIHLFKMIDKFIRYEHNRYEISSNLSEIFDGIEESFEYIARIVRANMLMSSASDKEKESLTKEISDNWANFTDVIEEICGHKPLSVHSRAHQALIQTWKVQWESDDSPIVKEQMSKMMLENFTNEEIKLITGCH